MHNTTYATKEDSAKAQKVREVLAYSTGSENLYKHWLGIHYTDGIMLMAQAAGARWLIDVVASYNKHRFMNDNVFQSWQLTKDEDREGWNVVCDDGNSNVLATQYIEYSDFPLPEGIKLYVCDGVLLLPGEY